MSYQPQKPDRRILKLTSRLGVLAAVILWALRGRFGIDTSAMCIITGIALLNLVMQNADKQAIDKNYDTAMAIKRNRESMNGNDIGGDIGSGASGSIKDDIAKL